MATDTTGSECQANLDCGLGGPFGDFCADECFSGDCDAKEHVCQPCGECEVEGRDASTGVCSDHCTDACMSCTKKHGYLVAEAQSQCILSALGTEANCTAASLGECGLFDKEAQKHCLFALDEVGDRSCSECALFESEEAQRYCLNEHHKLGVEAAGDPCTTNICMTLLPGQARLDCMRSVIKYNAGSFTCRDCLAFEDAVEDRNLGITARCVKQAQECNLETCLIFPGHPHWLAGVEYDDAENAKPSDLSLQQVCLRAHADSIQDGRSNSACADENRLTTWCDQYPENSEQQRICFTFGCVEGDDELTPEYCTRDVDGDDIAAEEMHALHVTQLQCLLRLVGPQPCWMKSELSSPYNIKADFTPANQFHYLLQHVPEDCEVRVCEFFGGTEGSGETNGAQARLACIELSTKSTRDRNVEKWIHDDSIDSPSVSHCDACITFANALPRMDHTDEHNTYDHVDNLAALRCFARAAHYGTCSIHNCALAPIELRGHCLYRAWNDFKLLPTNSDDDGSEFFRLFFSLVDDIAAQEGYMTLEDGKVLIRDGSLEGDDDLSDRLDGFMPETLAGAIALIEHIGDYSESPIDIAATTGVCRREVGWPTSQPAKQGTAFVGQGRPEYRICEERTTSGQPSDAVNEEICNRGPGELRFGAYTLETQISRGSNNVPETNPDGICKDAHTRAVLTKDLCQRVAAKQGAQFMSNAGPGTDNKPIGCSANKDVTQFYWNRLPGSSKNADTLTGLFWEHGGDKDFASNGGDECHSATCRAAVSTYVRAGLDYPARGTVDGNVVGTYMAVCVEYCAYTEEPSNIWRKFFENYDYTNGKGQQAKKSSNLADCTKLYATQEANDLSNDVSLCILNADGGFSPKACFDLGVQLADDDQRHARRAECLRRGFMLGYGAVCEGEGNCDVSKVTANYGFRVAPFSNFLDAHACKEYGSSSLTAYCLRAVQLLGGDVALESCAEFAPEYQSACLSVADVGQTMKNKCGDCARFTNPTLQRYCLFVSDYDCTVEICDEMSMVGKDPDEPREEMSHFRLSSAKSQDRDSTFDLISETSPYVMCRKRMWDMPSVPEWLRNKLIATRFDQIPSTVGKPPGGPEAYFFPVRKNSEGVKGDGIREDDCICQDKCAPGVKKNTMTCEVENAPCFQVANLLEELEEGPGWANCIPDHPSSDMEPSK